MSLQHLSHDCEMILEGSGMDDDVVDISQNHGRVDATQD